MDDITCGLFILSEGKLLIVHPTGQKENFWSIPKGIYKDEDITHLNAAIREVKEETGLEIKLENGIIKDLGVIKYKKRNKILHGFIFFSLLDLTEENLNCESFVILNKGDEGFPEVDRFKWIEFNEENISILHETQRKIISNFLKYSTVS
jgi:predicted NUDIX family NTP pyrophosphohydrolase